MGLLGSLLRMYLWVWDYIGNIISAYRIIRFLSRLFFLCVFWQVTGLPFGQSLDLWGHLTLSGYNFLDLLEVRESIQFTVSSSIRIYLLGSFLSCFKDWDLVPFRIRIWRGAFNALLLYPLLAGVMYYWALNRWGIDFLSLDFYDGVKAKYEKTGLKWLAWFHGLLITAVWLGLLCFTGRQTSKIRVFLLRVFSLKTFKNSFKNLRFLKKKVKQAEVSEKPRRLGFNYNQGSLGKPGQLKDSQKDKKLSRSRRIFKHLREYWVFYLVYFIFLSFAAYLTIVFWYEVTLAWKVILDFFTSEEFTDHFIGFDDWFYSDGFWGDFAFSFGAFVALWLFFWKMVRIVYWCIKKLVIAAFVDVSDSFQTYAQKHRQTWIPATYRFIRAEGSFVIFELLPGIWKLLADHKKNPSVKTKPKKSVKTKPNAPVKTKPLKPPVRGKPPVKAKPNARPVEKASLLQNLL